MKIILGICVFVYMSFVAQAYKMLVIFSYCAKSHYNLGNRLATELAAREHDVTFVNCFPEKRKLKNIKDVSVKDVAQLLEEWTNDLRNFGQLSYEGQLEWVSQLGLTYTRGVLKNKNVQDLINSNEEFDLIILEHFFNDALTIFHHRFKSPFIFLAPGPTTIFNNHLFANPAPPSYVPNLLSDYGSNMTLWQRFLNLYRHLYGELFVHYRMIPEHDKLLKEIFPDAPDLSSILYNSSLMLTTSHVSLSEPKPLQQNIKEIGGYHVFPPKPLPQDVKKFLDEAKEGVVVFSMGSNLKSACFEPEKKIAIMKAFSEIKQKVLWKFEEDLPEISSNVMILNWLPQQDVLAHPNVVAFISHGGLLGTIEAVYHGVPILGLPVYWDQIKNIEDAARNGYALRLNLENLNNETFSWALHEILDNPNYRKVAKERSKIMRDQPMKQIDEAIFWIEYVARHRGASHLKSIAVNLKWYHTYFIDILSIVVASIIALSCLVRFIFRMLLVRENKLKQH